MSPRARRSGTSKTGRYWSHEVMERSDALDLERGVFTWSDPRRIAASLKRSAEASRRRKGTPYQSAMSMLNFYINRAGKNLSAKQKRVYEQAKIELRKVFGRDVRLRRAKGRRRPAAYATRLRTARAGRPPHVR